MNKAEFMEYIAENFNIDIYSKWLISNILDFVEKTTLKKMNNTMSCANC